MMRGERFVSAPQTEDGGASGNQKPFPDYTPLLDPALSHTKNDFLGSIQVITEISDENLEVVSKKLGNYLATRQERGKDLESPEVVRARDMAHRYFDEVIGDEMKVIWELCMDGRTRKTIIAGVPGGFGGSQRFPGAKPPGFERNNAGTLRLNRNSTYARTSRRDMAQGRNFAFVVDSHRFCAARGAEERVKLRQDAPDAGLMADIKFKKEMTRAHASFIRESGLTPETLLYVPITFSPEGEYAGYGLLGLDTDASLRNAGRHDGFTQATIEHQIERGTILSLKHLAEDGLGRVFEQFPIEEPDWKDKYRQTSLDFWRNINSMKNAALPIVRGEIARVYHGDETLNPQQLEMTARVALLNAYAGWINNNKYRNSSTGNDGYPFSKHEESILVALEGGDHGPFGAAEALEVYRESDKLSEDAILGATIIARNRVEGRVAGTPSDPIPFVIQVASTGETSKEQLTRFADRLGRDLPRRGADFRNMNHVGFIEYALDLDPTLPGEFVLEFAKAAFATTELYRGSNPYSEVFRTGSIVPFPLIVGKNREPIVPLPLYYLLAR